MYHIRCVFCLLFRFAHLEDGKQNESGYTDGTQSRELSDQELAQASGGQGDINGSAATEWKTDSQGRVTHWNTDYGEVYHYICPTCGRILHRGSFGYLFCDPCDDWFTDPEKVTDTPGRMY